MATSKLLTCGNRNHISFLKSCSFLFEIISKLSNCCLNETRKAYMPPLRFPKYCHWICFMCMITPFRNILKKEKSNRILVKYNWFPEDRSNLPPSFGLHSYSLLLFCIVTFQLASESLIFHMQTGDSYLPLYIVLFNIIGFECDSSRAIVAIFFIAQL